MRRLTISLDIAFGKDEPEPETEEYEPGQLGSADTLTERRPSDEHSTRQIGFGSGLPWEDI
jgi:hypothetical protein